LRGFFIRALEYVDAQRVVTNHQTIFLHHDYVWFQTRTFWRVQLIVAAPRAFFIEAIYFVADPHPNVAGITVNADSVQNPFEYRRAILFLLAPDFTPDRLRHRRRFQSGVLHILAGIAEAVVFADGRLRRIREAVEKMAFGVAGQLPNVQEAIQIASISDSDRFDR